MNHYFNNIIIKKNINFGVWMESQKYEAMLNLSLNISEAERAQSDALEVGYNSDTKRWDVIVRYTGNIDYLIEYGVRVTILVGNYAILNLPESVLNELSSFSEIIYVEMPKKLYINAVEAIRNSCINSVRTEGFPGKKLYGEGVICALIDSGIDIFNSVFRNQDGTTRILELWDQTINGTPPEGYPKGSVYDANQLNEIISEYENQSNFPVRPFSNNIPGNDVSGHGTHVAGIMAGNFAENKNNNLGIATQSNLIVVKLDTFSDNGFPRTTELMMAIDYVYRTALKYRMPVAMNISIGNSYGSHDGTSLLETYIDNIANLWKMSICIGAGNEGNSAGHALQILKNGEVKRIGLSVGNYERSLNVQLWKTYEDEFEITVYAPGSQNGVRINNRSGVLNTTLGNNRLLVYYGEPSPYTRFQEIYFEMIPFLSDERYLTSGIWNFEIRAVNVISGRIDLWLPDQIELNENTRFTEPNPDNTLTIPSTSSMAITVGGYNSETMSFADFSGRGFTRLTEQIKPDILAPAVNIISAATTGGLTTRTGTSMATPFVTGSAALLMEWGIIHGNDRYLYGQKLKSYVIRGAKSLRGESVPSKKQGFGTLCLRDSIPV